MYFLPPCVYVGALNDCIDSWSFYSYFKTYSCATFAPGCILHPGANTAHEQGLSVSLQRNGPMSYVFHFLSEINAFHATASSISSHQTLEIDNLPNCVISEFLLLGFTNLITCFTYWLNAIGGCCHGNVECTCRRDHTTSLHPSRFAALVMRQIYGCCIQTMRYRAIRSVPCNTV